MEPKVLVVGETLIDILRRPDGTMEEKPGGSCANVALTLGRLNRRPRLLTILGDDDHGRAAMSWLHDSGVALQVQWAKRTSTATANLGADGAARYEFSIDWDLAATEVDEIDVLHIGSIAAVLGPGASAVAALADRFRDQALVTYDPNIRPGLVEDSAGTRRRVLSLMERADVVKASDEDIAWLFPGENIEQVARRVATSGPGLVVITMGADGALAVTRNSTIRTPAVQAVVIDTVGAGDTFMGTLVDGLITEGATGAESRQVISLLDPQKLSELVNKCARSAAITVSRPGADPPTRAELLQGAASVEA